MRDCRVTRAISSRQHNHHPIVALAPTRIVFPFKRRSHGGAWHRGGIEQRQRQPHGLSLHVGIPRVSAGVSQREVAENEAGHAAMLHDILGGADDDGGNAVGFEMTGDQTHGLVTDRSKRRQDRRLDLFLS